MEQPFVPNVMVPVRTRPGLYAATEQIKCSDHSHWNHTNKPPEISPRHWVVLLFWSKKRYRQVGRECLGGVRSARGLVELKFEDSGGGPVGELNFVFIEGGAELIQRQLRDYAVILRV